MEKKAWGSGQLGERRAPDCWRREAAKTLQASAVVIRVRENLLPGKEIRIAWLLPSLPRHSSPLVFSLSTLSFLLPSPMLPSPSQFSRPLPSPQGFG